jgi:hypothetical protein
MPLFDREQLRDAASDLARRANGNPDLEHVNRVLDVSAGTTAW